MLQAPGPMADLPSADMAGLANCENGAVCNAATEGAVLLTEQPVIPVKAMSTEVHIRRVDHTVDERDLETGARQVGVLLGLAPREGIGRAKVTRCKQGITNKLLKVSVRNTDPVTQQEVRTVYLTRVYGHGTSALIDRDTEVRNMAWLSAHGMAPPLHARVNNGLVYGFVRGTPAVPEDLARPAVWPAIARHLAEWHTLPLPPSTSSNKQFSNLFPTLDRWLKIVKENAGDNTHAFGISVAEMQAERHALETSLLPPSPVVFAHNDLLCGNVILQAASDLAEADKAALTKVATADDSDSETDSQHAAHVDAVQRARFIDYEYGGIGFAAFDVANHFCEWAGFNCRWEQYPSHATQRAWLRTYLAAARCCAAERDVPDSDLDTWQETVAAYTLAAHLYWILWALVQATTSDIDFDYAAYARMRWEEYHRWKVARAPPAPGSGDK